MSRHLNRRQRTLLLVFCSVIALLTVTVAGGLLSGQAMVTDFSRKNLAPCMAYPFGTDWMGRDMFARTLAGLSMSLRLGALTAGISAATSGRVGDALTGWLIDLVMGIPHILLLILISLACGRGLTGVVAGIALTHWPSLARLLRAELLQLRESPFIRIAEKLGIGRLRIVREHLFPHLLPQFLVGLVLLFPHAILHEASITFLGFGLPPEQPAIGVILSESMQYLAMGRWWLAVFPGALLVLAVMLFFTLGENLRCLLDPGSVQE